MIAEIADVGRLLAWASRPRDVPASHDEYAQLIDRYRNDPDFADAADAVFSGAGLELIVDPRDGAVVVAETGSPLRRTIGDISGEAVRSDRVLFALAMLGIARTAYPTDALLDSADWAPVFTCAAVVSTLDRAAAAYAETSDGDGPVDDDLTEVWRLWTALAETRPGQQRRSKRQRPGLVDRTCRFLAEAGYLTKRNDLDGGTWIARPRFRYAVAALCEDSDLYLALNDLGAGDTQELS